MNDPKSAPEARSVRLVACTIELSELLTAKERTLVCATAARPTVAILPDIGREIRFVGPPDDVIESVVDALLAAARDAKVVAEPLGDASDQDARHVATGIRKALAAAGDAAKRVETAVRRGAERDPLTACAPFLDAVAAATPLPGGGSCAALAGASAAALVEMIARLTIGRPSYAEVEKEMQAAAAAAEPLCRALHDLVRRDTEAYADFMDASRMPRDTEAEIRARREAVAEAARRASEIPLETMRLCVDVLENVNVVARRGNRNARTDAAVAAVLASAAGRAAWMNVRANLPTVRDLDLRARLSGDSAALHTKLEELADRALRAAEARED